MIPRLPENYIFGMRKGQGAPVESPWISIKWRIIISIIYETRIPLTRPSLRLKNYKTYDLEISKIDSSNDLDAQ